MWLWNLYLATTKSATEKPQNKNPRVRHNYLESLIGNERYSKRATFPYPSNWPRARTNPFIQGVGSSSQKYGTNTGTHPLMGTNKGEEFYGGRIEVFGHPLQSLL